MQPVTQACLVNGSQGSLVEKAIDQNRIGVIFELEGLDIGANQFFPIKEAIHVVTAVVVFVAKKAAREIKAVKIRRLLLGDHMTVTS